MKTNSLLFAALMAVLSSPLFATGATIAQQAYIKASNTEASDGFGVSVAVSGDTMVIGAPYESSSATGVNGNQNNNLIPGSGAAYVFARTGGVWVQQAYLKASNPDESDYFGSSVAISGDTVVIGAPEEDSSATGVNGNQSDNNAGGSGAAYVFVRNGTNWSQQAYLKASNTGEADYFANSVAISGNTVIVGAPYEASSATGVNGNQNNNNAYSAGAAYVFVRSGTSWTQQAYVKASNTDVNYSDNFGWSVTVSGDTAVVGAIGEASSATGVNGNQANNSASASGAAYVFVRNGTNWTQQAYLKASNTGADDEFGRSVAVSGDTIVVGAFYEDSNATGVNGNQGNNSAADSGAAYVFVRSGTTWSQQAYLKASNTETGDLFGLPVGVSGGTVVVGAIAESSNSTGVNGSQGNNNAPFSGAAYVFVRNGTTWSQSAYVKASNTEMSDGFNSLALSGNLMVVGAGGESSNAIGVNGDQNDNSASGSGAAYVFDLNAVVVIGPEIAVEQPPSTSLNDGAATVDFGTGLVGSSSQRIFTIKNTGNADLTGLGIIITGLNANDFAVTANPTAPLSPGGSTTFTVTFSPASGGAKTATLQLASNDSDESPFDIALTGTVLVLETRTFANAGAMSVPAFGRATPYPSAIMVAGLAGNPAKVTVTLSNLNFVCSSTYVRFRLVGPDGQTVDLMTERGCTELCWSGGGTSTFADGGTNRPIRGEMNGTFRPEGGSLSVFTNGNPNGNWQLLVEDFCNAVPGSGSASMTGWSISFQLAVVPPPQLAIEQTASNVRILWPLPAENFVLEEVNALNASPASPVTGWTPVPPPYTTNAAHISITVPANADRKFYRLRKP